MITSLVSSLATPLAAGTQWDGDTATSLPDPGYVFVFLADGSQLFNAEGLAVQVPAAYANS